MSNGRITEVTVALMAKWRHSGFSVHCGPHIQPRQTGAPMEKPARYIIMASSSQERLDHDFRTATVVYKSKDGSRKIAAGPGHDPKSNFKSSFGPMSRGLPENRRKRV